MKDNIDFKRNRRRLKALIVLAVLALLVTGLAVGYHQLRDLYREQCVIVDLDEQVTINAGKMVHPSNIAEEFGLKPGANLSCIDFAEKRRKILAAIPNLREVKITRHLPDKVSITVEERIPVARLNQRGKTAPSGRVVDTDGMVFMWQRGTQTLPTIREAAPLGTPKGRRIAGRTLAALRLIETCREPEFHDFPIREVDTSKHDFLVATLANNVKIKILWDEMDESTARSRKDLVRRLTLLQQAMRSRVPTDAVIWNATQPDQIFADTQGSL